MENVHGVERNRGARELADTEEIVTLDQRVLRHLTRILESARRKKSHNVGNPSSTWMTSFFTDVDQEAPPCCPSVV